MDGLERILDLLVGLGYIRDQDIMAKTIRRIII